MNMKIIKLLGASVVAATTLTAMPAHAQSSNSAGTSVDARAGLSPVLSMGCDGINFGVWRVPTRTTGGVTTITLSVSANNAAGTTTATAGGNTTLVALAAGYDLPTAGNCFIEGSNNLSKTIQNSISGATGVLFSGSTHNSLPLPTALAALSADITLVSTTGIGIDGTGKGQFRVTGVLTIPQVITKANYGGYISSSNPTLLATDTVLSPT